MARISNLRLQIGRVSTSVEFAELTLTVNWTSREVTENMWYLLSGYLVERDDGRDFYDMLPDGNLHWLRIGNLDDFIGTVQKFWVRPNGSSSRAITMRRNWDFGDQEGGNEEYLGVATVVPEQRSDIKFSNEVSINVG